MENKCEIVNFNRKIEIGIKQSEGDKILNESEFDKEINKWFE